MIEASPSPTIGEVLHVRRPSPARVSIVVPVFREAGNLDALWEALSAITGSINDVGWEFVFINDGSPDDSLERLTNIARQDGRVVVVDLSRNFGKEVALTAGLDAARGDAVIFMDADLQHPPSLIPRMVDTWRSGAEVVVTVRRTSDAQPLARKLGSAVFHWLMKNFADLDLLSRTTDFRLLDRKVVEAVRTIGERERLFRGLIDWLGFRRTVLEFDAPARPSDQDTTFSYTQLAQLAITGFVSHSLLPLRLLGLLGLLITGGAGLLLVWMLVAQTWVDPSFYYTPLAQVVVANTLLIGVVLTALGIMSLYLAKIYREVISRPLYAVRDKLSFPTSDDHSQDGAA